jgi:signal transduction histidine kinase
VGIAPDAAARVFEPFFTTARARGRTGLGLTLAASLVTRVLGGEIRLQQGGEPGTRIALTLPVQRDGPAHRDGTVQRDGRSPE